MCYIRLIFIDCVSFYVFATTNNSILPSIFAAIWKWEICPILGRLRWQYCSNTQYLGLIPCATSNTVWKYAMRYVLHCHDCRLLRIGLAFDFGWQRENWISMPRPVSTWRGRLGNAPHSACIPFVIVTLLVLRTIYGTLRQCCVCVRSTVYL